MPSNAWNAREYIENHSFVYEYGAQLLNLLQPQKGESILDIGCGTGDLTWQIAQSGASVRGIDLSAEMVAAAKDRFPQLEFSCGNILEIEEEGTCHAIHSNAVLHWIAPADQRKAAAVIYRALRSGGRFVAEFGGRGNCRSINAALSQCLHARGYPSDPGFYFPSVGEYSTLLEQAGFSVRLATLFHRPTLLAGERGMENWIEMFQGRLLLPLSEAQREEVVAEAAAMLKNQGLFNDRKKQWTADYVRLRILAIKPEQ